MSDDSTIRGRTVESKRDAVDAEWQEGESNSDTVDSERAEGDPDSDAALARRRFLRAIGATGGISVLAGCSVTNRGSDGTSTPPRRTTSESTTPTATPPAPGESFVERHPGLEIVSQNPPVGQAASRSTYAEFVTPIEDHYVVNHYVTPDVDADSWTVTLDVGSNSSVDLSLEALREDYPTRSVAHTMQCAGNGRASFDPAISGYQLSFGAAATAIWTGAPLRAVLERHGAPTGSDRWLLAAGGDAPADALVFARSIPMEKALEDCLLAYRMNGEPLPRAHGYPIRLIVPGWYGNNSVKWLSRLAVLDRMVSGDRWRQFLNWQQNKYRILPAGRRAEHHERIDEFDTWTQIRNAAADRRAYLPYMYDQTVKSIIGYPADGADVTPRSADGQIEVLGVAWAGDDRVAGVEVSTDGGETWRSATFLGPDRGPAAWRRFRFVWSPEAGEHRLVSRATDERGRTQPPSIAPPEAGLTAVRRDAYPWNQRGYGSNAYLPLGVHVTVSG